MNEKQKRIWKAIEETNRFIDREQARSPKFRPADMQQHLDFCIAHREKLYKMLSEV